jgi:hypothetical protein
MIIGLQRKNEFAVLALDTLYDDVLILKVQDCLCNIEPESYAFAVLAA